MGTLTRLSADGNVGPASGGFVQTIILAAGAAANATLDVKEGGSGGTIICSLAALQGTTAGGYIGAVHYDGQLYADLTGAGATATFVT